MSVPNSGCGDIESVRNGDFVIEFASGERMKRESARERDRER